MPFVQEALGWKTYLSDKYYGYHLFQFPLPDAATRRKLLVPWKDTLVVYVHDYNMIGLGQAVPRDLR
jgi:hypothetical protein